MTSWNERNKAVIEEFRTNGGRVKGWAPLMLLTTTGAKTGQPRIAPLMLVTDGDRLLAVASKRGPVQSVVRGQAQMKKSHLSGCNPLLYQELSSSRTHVEYAVPPSKRKKCICPNAPPAA